MGWSEVCVKIIINVFIAVSPLNKEVVVFHTVSYPVEPHIYCLETLLLDSIFCNTVSIIVVYLYWSGKLRMPNLIQSGMDG